MPIDSDDLRYPKSTLLSLEQIEDLRTGRIPEDALAFLPPLEEYRIVRACGNGAMGRVYLAHDTLLDRPVAIKLGSRRGSSPAGSEPLRTEARALARLSHPNVITIFRIGESAGQLFLVFEFIQGRALSELRKPMSQQRALELGLGLARGLAAAHRGGVLHRDIKPSNAMVSVDGTIKLIDFGLARIREEADGESEGEPRAFVRSHDDAASLPIGIESTLGVSSWPIDKLAMAHERMPPSTPEFLPRCNARVGTPRYMAPEIWRGEASTPSADVYGLGIVLYELLSGMLPHSAASVEALSQEIQHDEAPPLSMHAKAIDTELCAIVDRCLRRAPERRFQDAEALCHSIERIAGKSPSRAHTHARAAGCCAELWQSYGESR